MRICPVCGEEKPEEDFRGDICTGCKVKKKIQKTKEIFEVMEGI